MINVLISGANGKMGKKVFEHLLNSTTSFALCGVDREENFNNPNFPIYSSFDKVQKKADVIIDFSVNENAKNVLSYAIKTNTPVVLCTTGYSEELEQEVIKASKSIAIFRSGNMSLGINVLIDVVKSAVKSLYGFDIEIIEKHHNQKIDSPSGTALMLANGIKDIRKDSRFVYGREGIVGKRDEKEIGIHSIRGGNIVGEHQVIFAGDSETLTFTHQATDRTVFAVGAVKAAEFIADKKNGLYNMDDMIKANA